MITNNKKARKAKRLVIQVQTRYGEGHPKQGEDAGFSRAITSGKKIHFIHPGNEEIIKLYDKLAARRPGKRTAALQVTYIDEQGKEILHRDFIRIQKITICYDPQHFKQYEMLKKERLESKKPLVPLCCVEVDGREIPDADNISDNSGLSRQDFNDWFFKDRAAPDYFEGYVLQFTKTFNY